VAGVDARINAANSKLGEWVKGPFLGGRFEEEGKKKEKE